MGEIEGRWLEAGKKVEMVLSIEMAKEKGISIIRTCGIWEVNRRRVNRWRSRLALGKSLDNARPGPKNPVHKLLSVEREAVLQMAKASNTSIYPTGSWRLPPGMKDCFLFPSLRCIASYVPKPFKWRMMYPWP